MTACPRCEGQGRLLKATIVATREDVIVCDECEALWVGPKVESGNFVDLMTYLRSIRIDNGWSALDVHGEL